MPSPDYLRILPLLLILAVLPAPRAGSGREGPPISIPNDSIPELIHRLERDPLDRSAQGLRRRLLTWMATARLGSCGVDATYIEEVERQLERREHPYRDELSAQYMLGAAGAAATMRDDDSVGGSVGGAARDSLCLRTAEAGLRSMIAAYRSMAQQNRFLKNHYLDSLDGIRRHGLLGAYLRDRKHQEEKGG